jgi:hypothetical protein
MLSRIGTFVTAVHIQRPNSKHKPSLVRLHPLLLFTSSVGIQPSFHKLSWLLKINKDVLSDNHRAPGKITESPSHLLFLRTVVFVTFRIVRIVRINARTVVRTVVRIVRFDVAVWLAK